MKIINLKLYTNNLEEQKQFYNGLLGNEYVTTTKKSLSIIIGDSTLTFEQSSSPMNYHFAINIPSNKIEDAANWLSKKTNLLTWKGSEIVEFPNWNAKGVYFYDKSKNIVELISRKNLNQHSSVPFSPKAFLHISEIGLATRNISQVYSLLNKEFGLKKYDGELERFCAIGDETGLFISVNYTIKKWIPNMDEAIPFPFEIVFENNQGDVFGLRYENENIIKLDK